VPGVAAAKRYGASEARIVAPKSAVTP
jgi:hypothetical protein